MAVFYHRIRVVIICQIMAISFCLAPALGMDRERVEAIVDSLKAATGQGIRVVVEDLNKPDAYLHPMGYIVITAGLVDLLEDDAEMAFVIGHEAGHIAMGHYNGDSKTLGIAGNSCVGKEIEADAYSLKVIETAGYNPTASIRVLSKIRALGIGQIPSIQRRVEALSHANDN